MLGDGVVVVALAVCQYVEAEMRELATCESVSVWSEQKKSG